MGHCNSTQKNPSSANARSVGHETQQKQIQDVKKVASTVLSANEAAQSEISCEHFNWLADPIATERFAFRCVRSSIFGS